MLSLWGWQSALHYETKTETAETAVKQEMDVETENDAETDKESEDMDEEDEDEDEEDHGSECESKDIVLTEAEKKEFTNMQKSGKVRDKEILHILLVRRKSASKDLTKNQMYSLKWAGLGRAVQDSGQLSMADVHGPVQPYPGPSELS